MFIIGHKKTTFKYFSITMLLCLLCNCSPQKKDETTTTSTTSKTETAGNKKTSDKDDDFDKGEKSSKVTGASLASAGPECETKEEESGTSFTCDTYFTPASTSSTNLTADKEKATTIEEGYTVDWEIDSPYRESPNGSEECEEWNEGLSIKCLYRFDNNSAIVYNVSQTFVKNEETVHNASDVAKFKNECDDLPSVSTYNAFGNGVAGDPYLICYAAQLWDFANNACTATVDTGCSAHLRIGRDMDGSGIISMIGALLKPFTGHFFGNGYTISNIDITGAWAGSGIFRFIGNGAVLDYFTIKDSRIVLGTLGMGNSFGGLLVGRATAGSQIRNVKVINSIVASSNGDNTVGGLVGELAGSIYRSSVAGQTAVGGPDDAYNLGGLVGYAESTATIDESYADVSLTSDYSFMGGLVGDNSGTIRNCYSLGTLNLGIPGYVGGLVGINQASGTISNSFAAASIISSDPSYGGAFVGLAGGTFSANYFDTQVATITNAVAGTPGDATGITGKTTAQMKTQATFSAWDFTNTWSIDTNAYPSLIWQ